MKAHLSQQIINIQIYGTERRREHTLKYLYNASRRDRVHVYMMRAYFSAVFLVVAVTNNSRDAY